MLIVLTAILITLILLICGDKGSKSILSTAMNAGLLLLAVFLIYRGLDPILITVAACILIACITLFIPEEANIKSKTALLSVILVILVVVPFVYSIAGRASIQGFTSEQYEITDSNGYTRNIGIDMLSLQISVMIIALIGRLPILQLQSHRLFTKYIRPTKISLIRSFCPPLFPSAKRCSVLRFIRSSTSILPST